MDSGQRARRDAAQAANGELAFGTMDSWLIWQLTDGQRSCDRCQQCLAHHALQRAHNQWDAELMAAAGDPRQPDAGGAAVQCALSATVAADLLGHRVPVGGVAGDQQSALFGQACFSAGMAKNTYGTGCFMLMHTGSSFQISGNGLITTSAAQTTALPEFALEGSVFVGGAVVQWLRDGLNAIQSSSEVQALAESVPDSGGVMVVPAFTGLGAPYWKPDARGSITGLTRGSTLAHIARAALESIAYQSAALLQAMGRDAARAGSAPVSELRVDGGACVNDLLMQFQADLLGIPVVRPAVIETTALGAAYLAGLTSWRVRQHGRAEQIVARRAPLYPHHGARARAGHDGPLGACGHPDRALTHSGTIDRNPWPDRRRQQGLRHIGRRAEAR
jgi:glycerol kinase